MLLIEFVFFIIAVVFLVGSVNVTIGSLTKLAKNLQVSEFVIATVLMGTMTSLPEFFVGISSAINDIPQISLGNVIGASILDLTLIIAIPLLIVGKIKPKSKNIGVNVKYMAFILGLPIIFMLDKVISRVEGFLLLVVFIAYIYHLLQRRKFKKITKKIIPKEIVKHAARFTLGIIILLISSHFVVKNANIIAVEIGLSQVLFGLFMISIGTSLPELTFAIKAALSKHHGMVIGDAFGSLIANILLVVGTTSLIKPIIPDLKPFIIGVVFLLISFFVFYSFVRENRELNIKHGIILILIYVLFVLLEFLL